MHRPPKLAVVLLLALLALLSGCKKKKPQVPQPQEQAPTISTTPVQPPPEPQPQPQPPAEPQPSEPSTTTVTPQPKPKRAPKKKVAKKTPPKTEPSPGPAKKSTTVVRNGSAENGQLSAGLPPSEATQQRQNAAQLLAATDSNLRGLNRELSTDEQAMVQQIRAYMQQSRAADTDGDTERAYNLAMKANLLSKELVKVKR